jgi:hypothetical protein
MAHRIPESFGRMCRALAAGSASPGPVGAEDAVALAPICR